MEIREIEKLFSSGRDNDKVKTVLSLEMESRNREINEIIKEAEIIADRYGGVPSHYIPDEIHIRFRVIEKRINALRSERMTIDTLLLSIPPVSPRKREPENTPSESSGREPAKTETEETESELSGQEKKKIYDTHFAKFLGKSYNDTWSAFNRALVNKSIKYEHEKDMFNFIVSDLVSIGHFFKCSGCNEYNVIYQFVLYNGNPITQEQSFTTGIAGGLRKPP
jgi:hypothetical protein